MASDNELLVLIYENIQKTLNQMKDTRVVIQTLANRIGTLERVVDDMDDRTNDICERIGSMEKTVSALTTKVDNELSELTASNVDLTDTIDAMRGTLENVTTPGIVSVSDSQRAMKDSVRELNNIHSRVSDEFIHYELRLSKLEDIIVKMLKGQLYTRKEKEAQKAEKDVPQAVEDAVSVTGDNENAQ